MGGSNLDGFRQLELIKRIKALADTGLIYAENGYDRERYEELMNISLQLMAHTADRPLAVLKDFFMPANDYPTVKVDVRGFVLNEADEILMAKESVDGKWAIPGGWADVGDSPSEAVVKEIYEETGLTTKVVRLLAVYDKKCHPHPPQPFYIYKLNFLCKITGGKLRHGFDMQGAAFFRLDTLPELSEDRILKSQLEHLYQLVKNPDSHVYFD
ncbi:NUDIX hydrolase [Flavobacteriaceae bacterium TP-CH-4]|uniref:NUDIX hydrolase n=1 Tax=Pelagihabitans pacificus TaxID=2696054 RepID=A0A967AR66_9FLAO|nr:NUDIX hydrolase [Pelagihabitans pacificus]NHF58793.1 NUDIX hydrolase [Pelagihabitans pacificus]